MEPNADDSLICICRSVPESAIVAAIRSGCRDMSSVQRKTGAATTCGDCESDVAEIIEDVIAEDVPDAGLPGARETVQTYLQNLASAIEEIDIEALTRVAEVICSALRAGHRVYVCGNGGSAAAAIHMAADWNSAIQPEVTGQSIALCENISLLTAIANDRAYSEIFARQLELFAAPDDVLVLLSVSGASPNLVRAAEAARRLGMTTVAAVGHPGAVVPLCRHVVVMGRGDYGWTEDLHLALNHIVVRLLVSRRPTTPEPSSAHRG